MNKEKNTFINEVNHQKKVFLKNFFVKQNLLKLSKVLLKDRPYIITINSVLDDFNDPVNSNGIIDDITDLLYNLITSNKQVFLYTKQTIRLILEHFLPYTFFLSLDGNEAVKIKKTLKAYDNAQINAFIKIEKQSDFSIFTWSSNFYELNTNFYSNFNQTNSLHFFEFFTNFLSENYFNQIDFPNSQILENYGSKPIVLLTNLKLDEAILISYYFQNSFKDLPFDLLITNTRTLKRQKAKNTIWIM